MDEATKMPALFVGHGSPMNTLENNRYTDAWRDFGSNTPKPQAILAISAHWYTTYTAVTAMAHPRTIHDFGGFPDDGCDPSRGAEWRARQARNARPPAPRKVRAGPPSPSRAAARRRRRGLRRPSSRSRPDALDIVSGQA